jgi:hypothetical protein
MEQLTYNDDIGTTLLRGTERTTLREPVSLGIVLNPVGDSSLLRVRNALVRVTDALENVVLILRDSENARSWLGD